MPRRILSVAVLLFLSVGHATASSFDQNTYPGDEWIVLDSPQDLGWSPEKLAEARAYSETIDTAAVMVIQHGVVVYQWGETERRYRCHSMRKSILSSMFGMYVGDGTIDLSATLADLDIDDKQGLTDLEKTATVTDLLTARSSIYHPASYEPSSMKTNRPERGSRKPGEGFFYNNWDFNALCTIYEQQTNTKIFEDFERRLANPLQMQDFCLRDGRYLYEDSSVHPAYTFLLTARDLARFGLMMARGGRWGDTQITPEAWVEESTQGYSQSEFWNGFGYMWWTNNPGGGDEVFGVKAEPGSFGAAGSNGHHIVVMPKSDIVIVHRVNTTLGNRSVDSNQFAHLLRLILAARPPL